MKASAIAPANIAIIKHWGHAQGRLPASPSLSMNLASCTAHTTICFDADYDENTLTIELETGEEVQLDPTSSARAQMIFDMVNAIAKTAEITHKWKAKSQLNFPMSAGIASSASGVCALWYAACSAILIAPMQHIDLMHIAGSGSALRSAHDGWGALFQTGKTEKIAGENEWNLVDIIAVSDTKPKQIGSLEGHDFAAKSPLQKARITMSEAQIRQLQHAISQQDFSAFLAISESQALALHAVMMSGNPSLNYTNQTTGAIIAAVYDLQKDGISVTWTLDAGSTVHVLTPVKNKKIVESAIAKIDGIEKIISSPIGKGATATNQHLF